MLVSGFMKTDFKPLYTQEYPGRLIIIGAGRRGATLVLYAQTGRTPASQARRLTAGTGLDPFKGEVLVVPTDEQVIARGNVDLLVYTALLYNRDTGLAVSNGKQTTDIFRALEQKSDPVTALHKGLADWSYEPDGPIFTPRISGCVQGKRACLNIIKKAQNGAPCRYYYDFELVPGVGQMISTYGGPNINPLPSFSSEPLEVDLDFNEPDAAVAALFEALGPRHAGGADFRVAALCAFIEADGSIRLAIKNR